MAIDVWASVLAQSADAPRARQYLDKLKQTPAAGALAALDAEQARILGALLSGSQALSELLVANPAWFEPLLSLEAIRHPRKVQGLRREVAPWLAECLERKDYSDALARLRRMRMREMLRIAVRDLARLSDLPATVQEISDVADVCLETVLKVCQTQLEERFGSPYEELEKNRWVPCPFCVLGLGKLGGHELNYSSDIDVIFIYGGEGSVFQGKPGTARGRGHLSNHQFFTRLAEAFVAEVGRLTEDGTLFRIDLRLRPEGQTGPLVRSLASYENYYAQWGQTWERMMLIKARPVAGDTALAGEFLEMVQPFRYPRSIGQNVLREIAAMKDRIESEVVRAGELERNVKLGRGGIREIEFIAQTLQLIHAGKVPFLQGAQTLPTLGKAVQYQLLPEAEATGLKEAYIFLRDVEHRLQMENNLQTHSIPPEEPARLRLARLMGFTDWNAFEQERLRHTGFVREVYDRLLRSEAPASGSEFPPRFDGAEADWAKVLERHHFRDPAHAWHLLRRFALGPGFGHVSNRTTELARGLFIRMLGFCPGRSSSSEGSGEPSPILSDPDRVLARLDSFVEAYGARATLYEMWTANPSLFELMMLLFDRSEFLAEVAIRTADLVDELVLSGHLRRRKQAAEVFEDLQHGRADKDQGLWLRRYHKSELMRIGLRDILGLADFEQNLAELTALADASLQYGLEVVLRRHKLRTSPFAIIGLGKLGGGELTYGSDLDIIFVARDSTANLPRLQKIAAELLELLSEQTEAGMVFAVDARLRPDGENGLLVNTLHSYEEYYRQRAQLWEIQTLSRARPVAGNAPVGRAFMALAGKLTNFQKGNVTRNFSSAKAGDLQGLKAWREDWKSEIARMRLRIEKERTPAGADALAIKTGVGGLIDAEFIAQALALEHGWLEPNTLAALQRAQETGAIESGSAAELVGHYRQLRRVEGVLRRWSYEGEVLLPREPEPLYRVAVRCGWSDAEKMMEALGTHRAGIRAVYHRVFPKVGQPAPSSATHFLHHV